MGTELKAISSRCPFYFAMLSGRWQYSSDNTKRPQPYTACGLGQIDNSLFGEGKKKSCIYSAQEALHSEFQARDYQ